MIVSKSAMILLCYGLFAMVALGGCSRPKKADTVGDTNSSAAPAQSVTPVRSVWTPDPILLNDLKQKGEVGAYQILLPQKFSTVPPAAAIPPNMQIAAWSDAIPGHQSASLITVTLFTDTGTLNEASKNMRQMLVNYSAGLTDSSGIKISRRGPTETGRVNGVQFSRFVFWATGPNQQEVQGLAYGAIDDGHVVAIVGMCSGASADAEIKLQESAIATFKKR